MIIAVKDKDVEISIIIVFYSNIKLLKDTISSILISKTKVKYEIIVVDNGYSPTTKRILISKFPKVKLIKSPRNIGYGPGNNLGVTYSHGKYLFILNPDVKLTDYCLDKLLTKLASSNKIAAVSPVLLDLKGNEIHQIGTKILDPIGGIFILSFLNKLFPNNIYSRSYWDFSKKQVEVLPGSAFLIKKDVFEQIGRFDENYFLFFEEFDLFKRLKEKGLESYYVTDTFIYHRWSLPKSKSKTIKKEYEKSRFYYFKKHYGLFAASLVDIISGISKTNILLLSLFMFFIIIFWLLK